MGGVARSGCRPAHEDRLTRRCAETVRARPRSTGASKNRRGWGSACVNSVLGRPYHPADPDSDDRYPVTGPPGNNPRAGRTCLPKAAGGSPSTGRRRSPCRPRRAAGFGPSPFPIPEEESLAPVWESPWTCPCSGLSCLHQLLLGRRALPFLLTRATLARGDGARRTPLVLPRRSIRSGPEEATTPCT